MRSRALCLIVISLATSGLACINIVGTKYNGERSSGSGFSGVRMLNMALKRDPHPDGVKMEADLRGATNFNDRSDYSAALMYLGRNQEAIELLTQLEKEKPGEYFIAGNLGTAYELSGNNKAALYWIEEEIKRDPTAHEGTEWLHAKILKAKIGREKDPDFFKKHSVLELQPENISSPMAIDDKWLTPKELTFAIENQLAERLQFVKPPDAPVASLLFDYAAIEAATRTLESAQGVLKMALDYGYPPDKVEPLMKLYEQRIAWRKTKGFLGCIFLGICLLAVLFLLYKRGIFVLSSRDLKQR